MKNMEYRPCFLSGGRFLSTQPRRRYPPPRQTVSLRPRRFCGTCAGNARRRKLHRGRLTSSASLAGMPGSAYDNPRTADDAEECGWLSRKLLPDSVTRAVPTWPPTSCGDFPSSPFAPRVAAAAADALFFNHEWLRRSSFSLRTREFQRAPRRDSSESIYRKSVRLSAPATSARPAPLSRLRGKKGMPTHITSIPPTSTT